MFSASKAAPSTAVVLLESTPHCKFAELVYDVRCDFYEVLMSEIGCFCKNMYLLDAVVVLQPRR